MPELTAETATEYDFVVALDSSGSMALPSKRYPGKSRWEEAQEIVTGLVYALSKYDSDGLDLVLFGATVEVLEGVTPDKVVDVFKRTPRGSTPLAEALAAVADLNADGKKAVAIVLTDGEPDSKDNVIKQITSIADKQESDDAFTILFLQVGDDNAATKFLSTLDDDLDAKFDIVDAITAAEAEQYEPLDLINKAIND